MKNVITRPVLPRHVRYRRDEIRGQHQLVYPEGVLVLNETAAAIVRLCDGRSVAELHAAIEQQFPESKVDEVTELLDRLTRKGLVREAGASPEA